MPLHVALRCDARPDLGVGHVVRCLALADELRARGLRVTLVGDVEVSWVGREVTARGLHPVVPPADADGLAALCTDLAVDALVLDGYHLDPASGAAARAAGIVVLAVVDGAFGDGQAADLYLDQNLGARPASGPQVPASAGHLLGLDHVLFRDEVLAYRRPETPPAATPPRVLCVFGGTDAYDAAPVVVPLVLATGRPVHVVAVAARPDLAAALERLTVGPGQRLDVIEPTPDLARLAAGCDAAVVAAGTSMWELLCLGVPFAVVTVADNQRPGYETVVAQGVALPLGSLSALSVEPSERATATRVLDNLLTDAVGRASRAAAGAAMVDGHGRVRVVTALLDRLASRPPHPASRPHRSRTS